MTGTPLEQDLEAVPWGDCKEVLEGSLWRICFREELGVATFLVCCCLEELRLSIKGSASSVVCALDTKTGS